MCREDAIVTQTDFLLCMQPCTFTVALRFWQLNRSNYDVLVEVLANLTVREMMVEGDRSDQTPLLKQRAAGSENGWHTLESGNELYLGVDADMLSPRNAFVSVSKGE